MKTRKPLRRTAFRRQRAEGPTAPKEVRPWAAALSAATVKPLRTATYTGSTSCVPVEKEQTIECEAYRKLVAALPCMHCGIFGWSQAAHPNTDKAVGKKLIDDRLCFPLCTVHPSPGGNGWVSGCHERFDQGGLFTKEARRELEPAWGAQTRAVIVADGNWPARLPMLTDPG